MKIIIIEDELPSARLLKRKIEKLGYKVLTILQSIEDSVIWLSENPEPDLMFMDIQLADGISFEILEQAKPTAAIIFTTAYDEYSLKAFKQNSIDYLLKPINDDELVNAIEKFKLHHSPKQKLDLTVLEKLLTGNQNTFKERFTIKIGQSIKILETKNIECLYSKDKGTYAQSDDGSNYLMDQTLDTLEKSLSHKSFFRINRGYIIHITAIKDIAIHSNSRLKVYLKHFSSEDLIVAREKVVEFKTWLDQ